MNESLLFYFCFFDVSGKGVIAVAKPSSLYGGYVEPASQLVDYSYNSFVMMDEETKEYYNFAMPEFYRKDRPKDKKEKAS